MINYQTFLSPPTIFESVQNEVMGALESGFIAPFGPKIIDFENHINSLFSNKSIRSLALNSGTSAIHLGIKALDVQKGDLVICQSLTFIACFNAIRYLDATPVFIDSERDSWNIDPNLLEEAIIDLQKEGKKPKAILAVHIFGNPYQVERLNTIRKKYDIPILEDAAEALGSSYGVDLCGNLGDCGVFSFNGNKIISTGGGGVLITKNEQQYKQGLFWATQAKEKEENYIHRELGYNYRMSNILAAIGCGMLPHLNRLIQDRIRIFELYKTNLSEELEFQPQLEHAVSNRWLTVGLCKSKQIRDKIIDALVRNGIESRPVWTPMHVQPIARRFKSYRNGISEDLSNRGICLPSGYGLDPERIIEIIKDIDE